MKQAVLVLTALLTLGCGGRASESDSGEFAKGGQASVAGGGPGLAGGGGVTPVGGGGQVPETYIPDSNAPFNGMHLDDGSFEDVPGFGWDSCSTKAPGSLMLSEVGASNGAYFLEFTSSPCTGTCSPDRPSDSQVYVWFGEGKHPTEPAGLYLDLINLESARPTGRFVLYTVDNGCKTLRPLFDVPLSDLSLSHTWSTRCFDLDLEPGEGLGFAVVGPQYQIGLDALRLGPTCH
jgi:hypothetical protein